MSVVKFAIRLGIGLAFIAYLILEHEVQAQEILAKIENMSPLVLLGALGLYLLGETICVLRWSYLARIAGHPAKFNGVLKAYFSGMFFNICLPTSIGGDVVRVVGLGRQINNKTASLASVFMDRNVGLSALLLVGLVASAWVSATIEITVYGRTIYAFLWPLFVLLIAGYITANAILFSDGLEANFTKLLRKLKLDFAINKVEKLHLSLRAYRQPTTHYAWPFVLSFVYQVIECGLVWLLATGLDIPVSPVVFFAIVPFQAVASLLPITFAGMGVREGIFCAVIMGQAGPAYKDEALALSLLYFGVVIVSSLIGGVVYMVSGMPRPSASEMGEAEMAPKELVS
jgi:uncharacterized protein (TIRG00374 family)